LDGGAFRVSGGDVNRNALVTATEISQLLGVSVQLVAMWRLAGDLRPVGKRGRSRTYRFGDAVDVEARKARAAAAANNHRARRPVAA
jgi:hypothetical protein